MLAYAAEARRFADRRHPKALLVIVGAHALLLGAVMTAKMTIAVDKDRPIVVRPIPIEPEPPPNPTEPRQAPKPTESVTRIEPIVPTPLPVDDPIVVDPRPVPLPPIDPGIGKADPLPEPRAVPAVVRTGPRFATPAGALRPPYPLEKRRAEEEAVLKLRLAIDETGRVVAVEPVGAADPVFLEAARKHLLSRWRYKPATEGGRTVASSTVVTLRFELED